MVLRFRWRPETGQCPRCSVRPWQQRNEHGGITSQKARDGELLLTAHGSLIEFKHKLAPGSSKELAQIEWR